VVGVSFWVSALEDVLAALAAAGMQTGVRYEVTGPAGAGLVYACLDAEPGVDPAADHAAAAERFVTVLRAQLAATAGAMPRGSVTVLSAPEPVRARVSATASGALGAVPGAALMRAVKDQFDPDHRMFPGRLDWEP
jgi:glycolate oxidase FAD binding subunit